MTDEEASQRQQGKAGSRYGFVMVALCLCAVALSGLDVRPGFAQRSPGRHGSPSQQLPISAAPSIQALTVDKNHTVYAGSFGMGIFRSEDRGRSWSSVNTGLGDLFVLVLAATPDGTVYAGTFQTGLFRSRDAGKSWQAINDGFKRLEVKALLIDDGVIYAGTGDGVYRLGEQEAKWASVPKGLDDTLVQSLAKAADQTLFAGTSGRGVFQRKAGASEWTRLSHGLVDHEGLVENFIRVLAMDREQALYAGTFDGGVFRSGDGGQTWRPISRALPNDSIRGIVTSDKGLFVATGRGIYKTVNQGRQWVSLNKGLAELSVQVLTASGDGVLYAGTSAGVFRSDNDGESWENVSGGLHEPGE